MLFRSAFDGRRLCELVEWSSVECAPVNEGASATPSECSSWSRAWRLASDCKGGTEERQQGPLRVSAEAWGEDDERRARSGDREGPRLAPRLSRRTSGVRVTAHLPATATAGNVAQTAVRPSVRRVPSAAPVPPRARAIRACKPAQTKDELRPGHRVPSRPARAPTQSL